MKQIKAKFQPFSAVIDGFNTYKLDDQYQPVSEEHARFIENRWGNLIDIMEPVIHDAEVTEISDATSTVSIAPEVTAEVATDAVITDVVQTPEAPVVTE